jgi:hypothetical protein
MGIFTCPKVLKFIFHLRSIPRRTPPYSGGLAGFVALWLNNYKKIKNNTMDDTIDQLRTMSQFEPKYMN